MKFMTLIIPVILLFASCDSVNIFGPDQSKTPSALLQKDYEVLAVNITGGFAGVHQELHIQSSGHSLLKSDFTFPEKNILLTPIDVQKISSFFEQNDFFSLSSTYNDPKVMDAFIYVITYSSGERTTTVTTNGFEIPTNLENIIEKIHDLFTTLSKDGLELELKTDKTIVPKNESINLTLSIKNTTTKSIQLEFSSSQIYDFYVSRNRRQNPTVIVWNWAQDKVFTQAINGSTLEAGKEQNFTIHWECKDYNGKRLNGTFFVTGELLSLPGGKTHPVEITIK